MPDYSRGCIYMIKKQDDYDNKNVYIGSCCNFSRRKCGHKTACNNENHHNHNYKLYQYIRENGGWNSWCMTKIIDYPCNSKSELNTIERSYIDKYKATLNCIIPTRTLKEWYNDNKDIILEKKKQYRIDNKNKVNEKEKQYYYNNKDEINERRRQRHYNNREKIKEYLKKYSIDNKD